MPDITAITFAIDAAGNVKFEPVPGNNPSVDRNNHINDRVTQGTRPSVIFRNDSDEAFTVHVTGVTSEPASGGSSPAPDPGRLFDRNVSGSGGGQTMFTVARREKLMTPIGPFPAEGTYLLSTGPGRTDGRILVHPVTLSIDQLPGGAPTISGGGGHLAVTRGVPLPVEFVNRTSGPVTVYTEGRAAPDHPESNPDPLAFFERGTVEIEEGSRRPVIRLMRGASKTVKISTTAPLGNFNFSTHPPPFPDAGPCVIHVHM